MLMKTGLMVIKRCCASQIVPALPKNICIQLFMGEDGLKEKVRQRKFEKNA